MERLDLAAWPLGRPVGGLWLRLVELGGGDRGCGGGGLGAWS